MPRHVGSFVGAALVCATVLTLAPAPVQAAPDSAASVPRAERPWIRRWSPEPHQLELGIFGGVMLPSRRLELYERRDDRSQSGFLPLVAAVPELGARFGWFPIRHLGLELEGAVMPARTRTDASATLWSVRAQLVGQIGLWSVVPFVALGTGALAVSSSPGVVGRDVDWSLHAGGGAKVYLGRWLALRLDVRDVVSAGRGIGGVVNSGEVLLGLSVVLGRAKDPEPRRPSPPPQQRVAIAPDPDRDGDGILDRDDACIDVPETANGFEDSDGCADALPEAVQRFTGVIEGIFFATDSAEIVATSRPTLDDAVDVLAKYPELRVRITGHTDDVGGREHNIELSQRRAEAVADYLVARGIAAERLETEGVGPDRPLVPNTDEGARARNRRIEFLLVSP